MAVIAALLNGVALDRRFGFADAAAVLMLVQVILVQVMLVHVQVLALDWRFVLQALALDRRFVLRCCWCFRFAGAAAVLVLVMIIMSVGSFDWTLPILQFHFVLRKAVDWSDVACVLR